ncbi:uncharacterized protein LOC119727021 [Patiria miniata]|uniref:Ig-like domain-containing protein n=1 Tax=Patiria miniata TaxID=46514 RepID=A0A913ZSZ0_PATMI|nr:uncharacterized protein LOC119727021 [Patiria miniata]
MNKSSILRQTNYSETLRDGSWFWDAISKARIEIREGESNFGVMCRIFYPDNATLFTEEHLQVFVVQGRAIGQEVILTQHPSPVSVGQPVTFTCDASCLAPRSSIQLIFDPREEYSNINTSSFLNIKRPGCFEIVKEIYFTATRQHAGLVITCQVTNPSNTVTLKTLVVQVEHATSLTLEMNSEVVDDKVDVKIGGLYRFTCEASGLNPANHTTWLIEKGGHQLPIKGACDWLPPNNTERRDVSSQICLNITEDHFLSRIVCRVLFSANGIYAEAAVNLSLDTPEPGRPTPGQATTFLSSTEDPVTRQDVFKLPIMFTVIVVSVTSSVVICFAITIVCITKRKYQQTRTKEGVATSKELRLTVCFKLCVVG